MGLPAGLAEALRSAPVNKGFEIWPQNMPVFDAFLVVATQWRTDVLTDGRVLWQGLDYASVRVGLDMADISLTPAQWFRFKIVERAAADVLNGYRG